MSFDGASIYLEVPAPTIDSHALIIGADLVVPAPEMTSEVLVPAIGYMVVGAPTVGSNWSSGGSFDASLVPPAPTIASSADNIWGVFLSAPMVDLSEEWLLGGSFVVSIGAPAPTMSGQSDAIWSGGISPPAPAIEARLYLEQLWAAALEVTPPELTIALLELSSAEYDETLEAWVVGATTWCVNAATLAHAEFTNFNFNSFAKFNGEDIACNESGIFSLSGATDDGEDIDARVMFAPSNFGVGKMNRVDSVYINARGAASLSLVTVFDEETVRKYDVDFSNDQRGIHTKRRKVGKGLSGVNIQIGIENRNGGDFDIESMEVVVVPLMRKS